MKWYKVEFKFGARKEDGEYLDKKTIIYYINEMISWFLKNYMFRINDLTVKEIK